MIIHNDCVNAMAKMEANSIDAIVCDPPYGLEFMGKEWDKLESIPKGYIECKSENSIIKKKMPRFHQTVEHNSSMQQWHFEWATQAYRVLKPGASMLVMGGTRTFHRLMVAIEDSGFIIKDTLMWLYGSGFPKAQDLGKLIDKRNERNPCSQFKDYLNKKRIEKGLSFNQINKMLDMAITGGGTASSIMGNKIYNVLPTLEIYKKLKKILSLDDRFDKLIEREEAEREKIGNGTSGKTAIWNEKGEMGDFDITAPSTDLAKHWDGWKVGGIKPAYEPIVWAIKPPEGSYVDNILKWGTGGINVDECRVGIGDSETTRVRNNTTAIFNSADGANYGGNKGRFPANIILSHHPECEQVGVKRVASTSKKGGCTKMGGIFGSGNKVTSKQKGYDGPDGLETVESWDCHPECPIRMLDGQGGDLKGDSRKVFNNVKSNGMFAGGDSTRENRHIDSGGASRFFYCAKASKSERNAGCEGLEEKVVHWSSGHQNPGSFQAKGTKKEMTNHHPTVKPIALMSYLIKLVTRKGQAVLDPFMGSGTTGCACAEIEREFIGIEKDSEYIEIARRRIKYWQNKEKQKELFT